MRATGRDISEIFGYGPDDLSPASVHATTSCHCPFIDSRCTKTNHDKSIVYGVCSVSEGSRYEPLRDVVVCPNRFYGNRHEVLRDVAKSAWNDGIDREFIVGGSLGQLRQRLHTATSQEVIVAFGHDSGKEISVTKMSMDWVLQRYQKNGEEMIPIDFVGIEVQSIDTTGNYRDNHAAYLKMRDGLSVGNVPPSGHGLNWANVHKRLIPQIIRKGSIYSKCTRCAGFFFILPDTVFERFEVVLGELTRKNLPSKSNLSVVCYALDLQINDGQMRNLVVTRTAHFALDDVKIAFIDRETDNLHQQMDDSLRTIL
jgi:hypothetical protein